MPSDGPKINALNPPARGLRVDIKKSIFSQPPRLSTSRLPLPHGSPRRSAKNALLYVYSGRELPRSAAAFSGGGHDLHQTERAGPAPGVGIEARLLEHLRRQQPPVEFVLRAVFLHDLVVVNGFGALSADCHQSGPGECEERGFGIGPPHGRWNPGWTRTAGETRSRII